MKYFAETEIAITNNKIFDSGKKLKYFVGSDIAVPDIYSFQ